jgi:hypothetical protein
VIYERRTSTGDGDGYVYCIVVAGTGTATGAETSTGSTDSATLSRAACTSKEVGNLKLAIGPAKWLVDTSGGRKVGLGWGSSNLLCTTWYQTSLKLWAA